MSISAFEGLRNEERNGTSLSDDDPILDFSSSRVAMPLDDQDVRVMQGRARMCNACQLFSKPMCTHNELGMDNGSEQYTNGYVSRRNGYQALAQEDGPVRELDHSFEQTHCHGPTPPADTSRREALLRLAVTSCFCFLFMAGEWLGGYLANSLAVMSDAAHLLSDFGSFLLSMFAIWLSLRRPTRRCTFGYYRAEVLGAVVSVLTIWVVTAVLVYMAVERMAHGHYDIDADTMLVVSGIGVLVNIIMGALLHGRCLGSGHGHSHGLSSSHSHSHGHSHGGERSATENINVRAATIHVLGDLIQSIGVLVAALIIKFKPEYRIADPICTLLFSAIVMATTVGVMRDATRILMESTPDSVQYSAVLCDLEGIEGVVNVHDLNIWSLSVDRTAITAHLTKESGADGDQILRTALALLRLRHGVQNTTVQVEPYDAAMEACEACQGPPPNGDGRR
ncbi:zinc transporter 2-like [Amphibalanus amphitrite]|uniref:zinc transporter 2-like n=1 Tax=Amphibalanus amphitrite TaxID=1232801 RepID=UPI001C91348B|nr:zinc transporter 2-like [Amphibalanus amphitrite]